MKQSMTKRLMSVSFAAIFVLSGCATVGDAVDTINPFSKSDEDRRKEQGQVAGQDDRISLLSLDETLQVAEDAPQTVILPEPYINPDWPQVGGNTTHAMQRTHVPGGLNKVWSSSAGKGSSRKGRILAPPVIAGGRIFTVDGSNKVSAFDAASGGKIWDHKVSVQLTGKTREGTKSLVDRVNDPLSLSDKGGTDKESVGGGIAVSDGKVYVTSGLGVIDALDAQSGNRIWRKRIFTPLHSAPKVANGRLFAITDDNELFALNAETGDVLWTYQAIVESARMLTAPSPAVIDDVVIAPFTSGEIVALRVQNGGVLWQDALSSAGRLTPLSSLNDIAAGPAIADGYVVASAQSGVMNAFDLRTGQRIWTQPAGTLGFPWIAGDFVYVVTTTGQAVCMSKLNGAVVWITQLQNFKNEKKRKDRISWTGPVMAGERLVTMSSQGKAAEIDPFTGTVIREFKVGGPVYVAPVVANGTLYVLNDDANLIALR